MFHFCSLKIPDFNTPVGTAADHNEQCRFLFSDCDGIVEGRFGNPNKVLYQSFSNKTAFWKIKRTVEKFGQMSGV